MGGSDFSDSPTPKNMIALLDCNNFYASCERVFSPEYRSKPVCILSNNDGCIIARSNELKAAGVPMGAPYHYWKDRLKAIGAVVKSSNYALYGDLSGRVMRCLQAAVKNVEVYSIDEAFLDLNEFSQPLSQAENLVQHVYQCVGIPVSVGLGSTKVLAKAANYIAKYKKIPAFEINDKNLALVLDWLPVEKVWGIGQKTSEKMNQAGIKTASDLVARPDDWIRKYFTITGLRTVRELRGESCLDIETGSNPRKHILCSRSFGRTVTNPDWLKEAIATHASRGAEKLREQDLIASGITVYIRTNRFRTHDAQYQKTAYCPFPMATANTAELITGALSVFPQIFKPGFKYAKVGIALTGLVPKASVQYNLFTPPKFVQSEGVMRAVDSLNHRFGQHTVRHARLGTKQLWRMRSAYRSPNYTTDWNQLLTIKI